MNVIITVNDLIFSSRIREVAISAGATLFPARNGSDYESILTANSIDLAIIDLSITKFDPIELASGALKKGVKVVGFLSHVEGERMKAAKEKGIDAMARSEFVKKLPLLLSSQIRC